MKKPCSCGSIPEAFTRESNRYRGRYESYIICTNCAQCSAMGLSRYKQVAEERAWVLWDKGYRYKR